MRCQIEGFETPSGIVIRFKAVGKGRKKGRRVIGPMPHKDVGPALEEARKSLEEEVDAQNIL